MHQYKPTIAPTTSGGFVPCYRFRRMEGRVCVQTTFAIRPMREMSADEARAQAIEYCDRVRRLTSAG